MKRQIHITVKKDKLKKWKKEKENLNKIIAEQEVKLINLEELIKKIKDKYA